MLVGASIMAVSCGQTAPKFEGPAYLDESLPVDVRVEDALSRMTLEEKSRSFMLSPSSLQQVFPVLAYLKYGRRTALMESVLR